MQPSGLSSNHPNCVATRIALQAIEEQLFANNEEFEPVNAVNASDHVNQLAELIARPVATSDRPATAEEASQSNSECDTISAIRTFFLNKNIPDCANLQFTTIQRRLSSINLTPASLMASLTILENPDHPTLRASHLNEDDCQSMILLLSDISNTRGRLSFTIRAAAENAQNNPHSFITRLALLMR